MGTQKYPYYLKSIFFLLGNVRPIPAVIGIFWRSVLPSRHTDQTKQIPPQIIHLPHQEVSFWVRGAMDVWSVKETFLDRFYERFGAPVGQGWTIVDIGGGIGDFTTLAARTHPQNRVYAFEPTPESFQLLQENLALNRIENVQAFRLAIWSTGGTLVIDTSVGEPGQFISRASGNKTPGERYIEVESISLAQAFEQYQITHCDLLKMDCEGAEYPILFTTPTKIFERVERIVMEYHDPGQEMKGGKDETDSTHSAYTHRDLERFLTERGYTVQAFQNYVHANLGYLYAYRPPQKIDSAK